ncbi:MAG: FapA family protein [Tepidanaerobacteraceae bacterium]|nr:FapA family protein [Tepidanaerobacteraceae bacterium]
MEDNDSKKTKRILKWAIEKTGEIDKKDSSATKHNYTDQENVEDAKVLIEISKNEMGATIFVVPPRGGRMLTYKEIIQELAVRKIVYGIDENKIKDVLSKGLFNITVQIASGLSSINGENGRVEYYFETNRDLKPRVLEDGKADFYNLNLVTNVKKGELLAKIIPPTKGIAGKTVTGKTIPTKNGKEARIHAGKNVTISEDGYNMFSGIDGQPIIHEGKLSVLPVLEIKGDVGPATGNINFIGSVIVMGNVKSGFIVKADGDVEVNGIVEASEIQSEGSIIIKRGVQGQGKGMLKARQDFTARYVENTTIEAGENITIADAAMHSYLFAGNKIVIQGRKGLIVGGNIKAGEELVAKIIGSPMSTYTEIEVGVNPELKRNFQDILNKLQQTEKDLAKIHQAMEVLARLKEKGLLTPDKQVLYEKLLHTKESIEEQKLDIEKEREKYDSILSHSNRAKVSASNVTYSGVNIIIGNASLKVRDQIKHATFYNYEGQIRFGPYEG